MRMLERVAIAICKADDNSTRHPCECDGLDGTECADMLAAARLAITAMREPDGDMVDAGRDVGPDAPYGAGETRERWRAMIDAALDGKHK